MSTSPIDFRPTPDTDIFAFEATTRSFTAMGTDCTLFISHVEAPRLLGVAEKMVARFERLWSRFIPTSEVSFLNSHPGVPCRVSPETQVALTFAKTAYQLSSGLFNPFTAKALENLGYSQDFKTVNSNRVLPLKASSPLLDFNLLWHEGPLAMIPPGAGLDFGGFGKGLAADLVAEELKRSGASFCLNFGGDVAAFSQPGFPSWPIQVRHDKDMAVLALCDHAVATSSVNSRTWSDFHHVLDPRTGYPTTSDTSAVSVVAPTGAWAEVASTCYVVDPATARTLFPYPALLSSTTGVVVDVHGFNRFVEPACESSDAHRFESTADQHSTAS